MPALNRVPQKYTVHLGNKSECGSDIELFECKNGAYRVIDNRILIPTPNTADPTQYVPLRAWQFPAPVDYLTMHIGFSGLVAVAGVAYPTLDYKILVGMGGNTDHVVTGSYTPPNKVQETDQDERGLLVQYCGRMFDTFELHVLIDDPDHQNDPENARKMPFVLGMYAILNGGHCESKAQTGVNGTISYVARTYMDPHDLVP